MADVPEAGASLTPGQRLGLPHRCEAVAEALASGTDGLEASAVAGQQLARDGVSLEESLERLRATWQTVRGGDPVFGAISTLATAWSETTLGYLHQMSCEDPLTGLASQAHLRSRISEVYRNHGLADANTAHALVVCELAPDIRSGRDHLARAMRLAQIGDLARTVFARGETVAHLGAFRIAVLATRDEHLGRKVRLLRTLVKTDEPGSSAPRVWIEGLPGNDSTAAMLLDELARN